MTTTTLDRRREAVSPKRPRPDGRGPRPFRWILGAIAVVVFAIVIFLALFNWDGFRPTLARMLSGRLHRSVRIEGHLKVHLLSWTPSATVEGLQIGDPDWVSQSDGLPPRDMADFGSITIKVKLLPLLIGRVILPLVDIERPNIVLLRDRAGRTSWDFSNGKTPAKPLHAPPIQNFVINDGSLKITDQIRRLSFSGTLDAHRLRPHRHRFSPDRRREAERQTLHNAGNRRPASQCVARPALSVRRGHLSRRYAPDGQGDDPPPLQSGRNAGGPVHSRR